MKNNYTRYIVSDSLGKPLYWYIHDAPKSETPEEKGSGRQMLSRYLKDACGVLKSEIDILADSSCQFTEANEKQLTLMLQSIISARKMWQEEEANESADSKPLCK